MSYKELVMQAYYNKYKKFPDDYPTQKPLTEDEKRAIDQLFGIPYFGRKTDTQKPPSVKGGDIDKNTAIRYPKITPKCGHHTQNE